MAQVGAAATSAGGAAAAKAARQETLRRLGNTFRWTKAFQMARQTPGGMPAPLGPRQKTLLEKAALPPSHPDADPLARPELQRYTNFSLQHIWEKYDFLQTHLLVREAVLPTIAVNPEVIDAELPSLHTLVVAPHPSAAGGTGQRATVLFFSSPSQSPASSKEKEK